MTTPKWQWPQVTGEAPFRPTDVIYERPDGQYRVLGRDGAPGWNLLVRDDSTASGWTLAGENLPTVREAQDRASMHDEARRVVHNAPPLSREVRVKLAYLLDVSNDQVGPNCPGSGRQWGARDHLAGTDGPVCPVCLADPGWLGIERPADQKGGYAGHVPTHLPRLD